ncbi:MAG TPA: aminopeptidase P family protein [Sphingomicrobium sp.]|nr:aminopeptidase P family protein [Sphingomicrobium sp.]
MFDRRGFMAAGAAASALASTRTLAQAAAADDRLYGYPGQIAPFGPDVYRERRARLMAQMKDGVAVVYGPREIDLDSTVAEVDTGSRDFFYLTGIRDVAGAALMLMPTERYREMLYLPNRNPDTERFEGVALPIGNEVRRRTGFERVSRIGGLAPALSEVAARVGTMRYLGPLVSPDAPIPRELDLYSRVAARVPGTTTVNNANLIRAMREAKEPRELELIRKAIAITGLGHVAAMQAARPGMTERQLRIVIEDAFRRAGTDRLAYPSIVGVARNSTVLHYQNGENVIRPGDLILVDAGCEYRFYASDVTRTFPVDGRFTPEQRGIYETVLAAQDAGAARLRAGIVYDEAQVAANQVMDRAGHRDDFWHGLGHFVGLDVHDVGDYARPLPANAVVTIEPGIYLPDREIGVRIEDDYLITPAGAQNLSGGIPRTVAEIEAVMAAR